MAITASPEAGGNMTQGEKSGKKRPAPKKAVGLGFRTHSGWAAVVAVAPAANGIEVIERRRIELADPKIPNSVQPYHAAENLDLKVAEEFINRCINSTRDLAHQGMKDLVDSLRNSGHTIAACGLTLASGEATSSACFNSCIPRSDPYRGRRALPRRDCPREQAIEAARS